MHACVSKGDKGLGHMTQGLGHPPQRCKVNKRGPLKQKRGSPSLLLFDLPLSLLQANKGPLSLAWVHEAKLGFWRWHAFSL